MLRGGNMWFRPAIFIWLVFAQSFFKFHKNGDIRKLKAWSFQLWKNDFCALYNKRARPLQSSITIFLIHPVYYRRISVCDLKWLIWDINVNLKKISLVVIVAHIRIVQTSPTYFKKSIVIDHHAICLLTTFQIYIQKTTIYTIWLK